MKKTRRIYPIKSVLLPCLALMGSLLVTGCMSTEKHVAEYSPEGMKLTTSNDTTRIYKAADADFSQYSKVQILEGVVAFKKNWQNDYNRNRATTTATKVKDEDIIKIKAETGQLLTQSFRAEFGDAGGYTLVEKPEHSTLILRPSIINLDLTAPDLNEAPISKTYTRSTGEATLYLEIYDGVTGQILARIIDADTIGNSGLYRASSRATYFKDARQTIDKWAHVLRTHFDKAHNKEIIKK